MYTAYSGVGRQLIKQMQSWHFRLTFIAINVYRHVYEDLIDSSGRSLNLDNNNIISNPYLKGSCVIPNLFQKLHELCTSCAL